MSANYRVLISGAGDLGVRVLQRLLQARMLGTMSPSSCVCETATTSRHARLQSAGFDVRLASDPPVEADYVVIAYPPRDTYFEDVKRSLRQWTKKGVAVLVSTSGVYSEDSGNWVDESSERSQESYPEVIAAEDWALQSGAHVVRMAGLYDLNKGPHIYWARKSRAPTRAHGWINLIHRADAAAALCEVLCSDVEPRSWNLSDGQSIKRFEVAAAWARHSKTPSVEFSDEEGGLGKRLKVDLFRENFFFIPRWTSFLDFVDSLARPRNVLGRPLKVCCSDPATGYFRDGFCRTDESDHGTHVVCAQVTQEFLDFSIERGNDLSTPRRELQFPGLKPGDCWCLCATRWVEALVAGVAPRIYLERTHESMLEWVDLSVLRSFAFDAQVDQN